jgi:hypothetical protein
MDTDENEEDFSLNDDLLEDEGEEDPLSMGFHEVDALEPEADF